MMMDVKENLQDIFRRIFDDDSILLFDEMTADDIEDWDSLMHMRLVLEIESEYQIEIPINEIPKINSLRDFYKYIQI